MKAIVCHGHNNAAIEEIPKPEITPTDVLVEIDRVQMAVTECWVYQGKLKQKFSDILDRMEDGGWQLFGHEFVGTVLETGSSVETLQKGDRVYAPGKLPCGDCIYCRSDKQEYCEHTQTIGFDIPGTLAEYASLPEPILGKVPSSISDAEAAALQPAVAALTCVYDAEITAGDNVVIIGAGSMGYFCGQCALQLGAENVIISDIDSKKVQIAEDKGIVGVDARTDDLDEVVKRETSGLGADVAFEAVGGDQTHITDGRDPIAQLYRTVRKGGTIVQVGLLNETLKVDPQKMRGNCIDWIHPTDVLGDRPVGFNSTIGELIVEMVDQNRISVGDHVSHELRGLDSFEEAVDITLNRHEHDALGPAQIVL